MKRTPQLQASIRDVMLYMDQFVPSEEHSLFVHTLGNRGGKELTVRVVANILIDAYNRAIATNTNLLSINVDSLCGSSNSWRLRAHVFPFLSTMCEIELSFVPGDTNRIMIVGKENDRSNQEYATVAITPDPKTNPFKGIR